MHMEHFDVTPPTKQRLKYSLLLIIAITLYAQLVYPLITSNQEGNVILMPLYPLEQSAVWKVAISVLDVAALCYIYNALRQQLRSVGDVAHLACLLYIVAKLVNVGYGTMATLALRDDLYMVPSSPWYHIDVAVTAVTGVLVTVAILWLAITLIYKYSGRLRVAGMAELVSYVVMNIVIGGVSLLFPNNPVLSHVYTLLSIVCFVLPPLCYYRAFRADGTAM